MPTNLPAAPSVEELTAALTDAFNGRPPTAAGLAAFAAQHTSELGFFCGAPIHDALGFTHLDAILRHAFRTSAEPRRCTVVVEWGAFNFDPEGACESTTAELAAKLAALAVTARAIRAALQSGPAPAAEPEYIDRYTRADAIADRVLIDLSGQTSNTSPVARFPFRLAMTATAIGAVGDGIPGYDGPAQGFARVLAAVDAAGLALDSEWPIELGKRVPFAVPAATGEGTADLVAVVHLGDERELVATIMLASED